MGKRKNKQVAEDVSTNEPIRNVVDPPKTTFKVFVGPRPESMKGTPQRAATAKAAGVEKRKGDDIAGERNEEAEKALCTDAFERQINAMLAELDKGWMGPLEKARIEKEMAELKDVAEAVARELGILRNEVANGQKPKLDELLQQLQGIVCQRVEEGAHLGVHQWKNRRA